MAMMVRTDKQPPREADLVPQLLGYLVIKYRAEAKIFGTGLFSSDLHPQNAEVFNLLNVFLQFNGFVLPKT